MDIKAIKLLSAQFSSEELSKMADVFEATGKAQLETKVDPGEQMSDYLQAAEVKMIMENQQLDINAAIREFSKRVRGILN